MELTQLKYFIETAGREHISKTAEALNLTQPALSKSISRLEADLGVKLFDRDGKNIRLNAYGQVVLKYAEQIFFNIGDMRAEILQMKTGMEGSIRIGSSFPAREPNWLLRTIQSFALSHPDVQFTLKQLPAENLASELTSRDIDLAVSSEPIRAEGFLWQELFTEPMGILVSKDHPVAGCKTVSMAQLVGERFYCNNTSSDVTRLTRLFCHLAGFEPNIHFEGDFPTFIGRAVSLGFGVSLISERGHARNTDKADREPWEDNIVYRPLQEGYCVRTCGIAHLESREYFPLFRAFRDALTEQFDHTG